MANARCIQFKEISRIYTALKILMSVTRLFTFRPILRSRRLNIHHSV